MRKLIALITLIVVSASAFAGEDVNDIVAMHIKAKGGLAKIKGIKSLVREGTMSMAQGMELSFTESYKRGGKYRMDMNFQGASIIQAFDGQIAWSQNPMAGNKPEKQSAEESKEAVDRADFDGPLVDYKEKGKKVEYVSTEDIDGTTAFKLKVTDKDGKESFLYIDATTYLEMRSDSQLSMMGQQADVEIVFGNFQEIEGVQMPQLMEVRADGQTVMSMTYTTTKANVDVPDARFAFPGDTNGKK